MWKKSHIRVQIHLFDCAHSWLSASVLDKCWPLGKDEDVDEKKKKYEGWMKEDLIYLFSSKSTKQNIPDRFSAEPRLHFGQAHHTRD